MLATCFFYFFPIYLCRDYQRRQGSRNEESHMGQGGRAMGAMSSPGESQQGIMLGDCARDGARAKPPNRSHARAGV
jgi:hypothetical protein